jgi:hypothetical protein
VDGGIDGVGNWVQATAISRKVRPSRSYCDLFCLRNKDLDGSSVALLSRCGDDSLSRLRYVEIRCLRHLIVDALN